MSLQDESFPHDAFFDDLSPSPNPRFQFPHRLRQTRDHHTLTNINATTNSSTASSSTDQNVSGESSSGCAPSIISNKTTIINSTETAHYDTARKPLAAERQKKSLSYQDIHTQYTKRRYKHVESKVGQYIANLKAEDERRRNRAKFQRHLSLPEALVPHDNEMLMLKSDGIQRYSVTDVHKLDESTRGDVGDGTEANADDDADAGDEGADSSQNLTAASSSSRSGACERSDDAGAATDFIDKLEYAQLISDKERMQSYNDYLQMKLDEKIGENIRLKQNVDYMRIKLSSCEDKLKRQMSNSLSMMGSSCYGGSMGSGLGGMIAGRHSLQALLYCTTKSTKATQTELPPTPPPPPPSPLPLIMGLPLSNDIYVTPGTPDANNNVFDSGGGSESDVGGEIREGAGRNSKSVATIQPMWLNFSKESDGRKNCGNTLRQRSNSQSQKTKSRTSDGGKSQHNSRTSHPSSNDSAIDFEIVELSSSPKPNYRKRYSTSPPTTPGHTHRYISYDPPVHRQYISMKPTSEASPELHVYNENMLSTDVSNIEDASGTAGTQRGGKQKTKKSGGSLRRRWLGIFRRCTLCSNPNQTLDNSALQKTYTQIPLLEASFIDNNVTRQNLRIIAVLRVLLEDISPLLSMGHN